MTPEEEYKQKRREVFENLNCLICPLTRRVCIYSGCAWWKGDECAVCKIADTLTRNTDKT